jgi:hypothetical protein
MNKNINNKNNNNIIEFSLLCCHCWLWWYYLVFLPIVNYRIFNYAPNKLEQAVLARSSCAKYCPPHSVILAASLFETRKKKHFKSFSGKDDKKGQEILKTYELIICRDVRQIINLFRKDMLKKITTTYPTL